MSLLSEFTVCTCVGKPLRLVDLSFLEQDAQSAMAGEQSRQCGEGSR